MKEEFLDYLEDIIKAMDDALRFVEGMEFEDFEKDRKTIYAAVRAIEIIGEAVKKIPIEIKGNYSQIPWKEMAGMRDKLIHEYFGIDAEIIWNTIIEDLPEFKQLVMNILKNEYSSEKH